MISDDAYGEDAMRFPRGQTAGRRDDMPPELEWDETEITELVDQILCEHRVDH